MRASRNHLYVLDKSQASSWWNQLYWIKARLPPDSCKNCLLFLYYLKFNEFRPNLENVIFIYLLYLICACWVWAVQRMTRLNSPVIFKSFTQMSNEQTLKSRTILPYHIIFNSIWLQRTQSWKQTTKLRTIQHEYSTPPPMQRQYIPKKHQHIWSRGSPHRSGCNITRTRTRWLFDERICTQTAICIANSQDWRRQDFGINDNNTGWHVGWWVS